MIKVTNEKEVANVLMQAFKNGNDEEIQKAFESFHDSIANTIKADYEEALQANDKNILSQRGFRVLTNEEQNFYEKFIEGAKTSSPKQALVDLLNTEHGMPETIIEDVYRDLVENHPLLAKVKFQNVKYLTSWLLNDHTPDQAVWGEINDEITKQIESGFKTINITQGKLSAFLVIPMDMLNLGPAFLDNYIRTILKEVMACGLEYGIVKGTGVKGEPIGLIRNISKDVSVNQETGYPAKEAIAVKDFTPASYGALVGNNLVKKEDGKTLRKITTLQMIVNPIDYLTKVMPATTAQNVNGEYKRDLFPIPTEVIQSVALDEGEAILTHLNEYFMGVGSSKEGVIEYSDEFKFLEDKRTYKTKMHAFGRAEDNTSAILLNIADLDPAYITVKHVDTEVSA